MDMGTRSRLLSLLLAFVVLAAACGGNDDATEPPTDGGNGAPADPFGTSEWRLVEATVDDTELELLDSHPITLRRTGDQVVGTAACNGYSGSFADGPLLFGSFAVTEMACDPPETMTLESLFLEALGRTDSAAAEGEVLVLTGDGVELRFEEVAPTPDADIEGTQWVLDTLLDGDAARSMLSGTAAGLRLDASTVTGTDGCNTFDGSYELDGDTLRVGPLAQTTRGCEPDVMEQARDITSVLSGAPTVGIDGDRLTLMTDSGLGLVYVAG